MPVIARYTTSMHPLDRPVWTALAGPQRAVAAGGPLAMRVAPRIGPFAAARDATAKAQAALAALVPPDDELWLVEATPVPPPPGTTIARIVPLAQLVALSVPRRGPDVAANELQASDAADMLALATLTRPGPFLIDTPLYGGFIGIRQEGRLIAMAGQRLRPPGFCEVSAVCTHPDHRGRGLAGALMRIVAHRILARGETPFLHSYPDNHAALALYRTLGFLPRRDMVLTVLART